MHKNTCTSITVYLPTMEIPYMTFIVMYKIRNVYRLLKNKGLKDKEVAGMMEVSSNQEL